VQHSSIYDMDIDVYAPCAVGGTLHDCTIPRREWKFIAGSANNQLENEGTHGSMLFERNILFARDYLINAGGLISCYTEVGGYGSSRSLELAENVYEATRSVIQKSKKDKISTHLAANKIAEERINSIRSINNFKFK